MMSRGRDRGAHSLKLVGWLGLAIASTGFLYKLKMSPSNSSRWAATS
ncbi:MAG: hypothetical protein R3F11_28215 [Verrucomicrobiales bacterium]